MDFHMGLYVTVTVEVTEIYFRLSSIFLYTSDTHLRQTPHIVLDLSSISKKIVLLVLYPFSNFYATYEK